MECVCGEKATHACRPCDTKWCANCAITHAAFMGWPHYVRPINNSEAKTMESDRK